MGDQDENGIWSWDGIDPQSPEDPNLWNFLVQKFGKYGEPGYTETFSEATGFASIFGHLNPVPIRWTLYRSESTTEGIRGQLVCVHGLYDLDEGGHRPFLFMVNPDFQRQGHGSRMADYVRNRTIQEQGHDLEAGIQFANLNAVPSVAQFLKKYVDADYAKRNGETQ